MHHLKEVWNLCIFYGFFPPSCGEREILFSKNSHKLHEACTIFHRISISDEECQGRDAKHEKKDARLHGNL